MDSEKNFKNIKMLLELENDYPGILVKTMCDFDGAKSIKETIDEEQGGTPIVLSWEEALKKFYTTEQYEGVTPENADLAELLKKRGGSQAVFDKGRKLREEQIKNGIPHHILGKPIREDTILESIEKIKSCTAEQIVNGKEMIDELWDKQFTYEWLDKYDPHNPIIGLDCSCCATIVSTLFGKDLAKKSMTAPDVQNLVVRDAKGEIIAKGVLYLNKEQGYGVFNDFEIHRNYKKHEIMNVLEVFGGRYKVSPNSKDEQKRERIFETLQRGMQAFIEEYDKQNPDKPLKQINVGMGYNKLKRQVEQFEKASENLTVPADYSFQDASEEQYILYKRETNEKEGNMR